MYEGTNQFRSGGKLQSTAGLLNVRIGGGDTANHGHFGITTEGGLQQSSQFRITKRDMLSRLLLGKSMDHSAE